MSKYPFESIEPKWQKYWDEKKTFKVTEDEKFPKDKRMYVLDMFPYPSAAGLHVGHPEGYTATDIYCRYLRMNGYNVLHEDLLHLDKGTYQGRSVFCLLKIFRPRKP